jgi:branched-chain amino acid transport system permease protein
MDFGTLLIQLLNGIQFGMLLFLIASGLTLTFGVMNIINLAHGAFFMLGAYFMFHLSRRMGLPYAASLALAVAGIVVLGAVVERMLVAPLAKRDHLEQLLVTYGLILIGDEVARIAWGPDVQPFQVPAMFDATIELMPGIPYPAYRLVISAVGLVIAIALWLLIARTRLGMIIRAGAHDRDMVRALGIDIRTANSAVFGIGAALAAIAGIVAAPVLSVSPGMGDRIIIIAFVVVVIGGIGSLRGAFVGALLVGLVDSFGKILFPALSSALIYLLMAAVLVWRPQGIFGAAVR